MKRLGIVFCIPILIFLFILSLKVGSTMRLENYLGHYQTLPTTKSSRLNDSSEKEIKSLFLSEGTFTDHRSDIRDIIGETSKPTMQDDHSMKHIGDSRCKFSFEGLECHNLIDVQEIETLFQKISECISSMNDPDCRNITYASDTAILDQNDPKCASSTKNMDCHNTMNIQELEISFINLLRNYDLEDVSERQSEPSSLNSPIICRKKIISDMKKRIFRIGLALVEERVYDIVTMMKLKYTKLNKNHKKSRNQTGECPESFIKTTSNTTSAFDLLFNDLSQQSDEFDSIFSKDLSHRLLNLSNNTLICKSICAQQNQNMKSLLLKQVSDQKFSSCVTFNFEKIAKRLEFIEKMLFSRIPNQNSVQIFYSRDINDNNTINHTHTHPECMVDSISDLDRDHFRFLSPKNILENRFFMRQLIDKNLNITGHKVDFPQLRQKYERYIEQTVRTAENPNCQNSNTLSHQKSVNQIYFDYFYSVCLLENAVFKRLIHNVDYFYHLERCHMITQNFLHKSTKAHKTKIFIQFLKKSQNMRKRVNLKHLEVFRSHICDDLKIPNNTETDLILTDIHKIFNLSDVENLDSYLFLKSIMRRDVESKLKNIENTFCGENLESVFFNDLINYIHTNRTVSDSRLLFFNDNNISLGTEIYNLSNWISKWIQYFIFKPYSTFTNSNQQNETSALRIYRLYVYELLIKENNALLYSLISLSTIVEKTMTNDILFQRYFQNKIENNPLYHAEKNETETTCD